MEGDQLKSESRPVVSRPRSGPLDGMEPAVQDTLSHAPTGVSATSVDESEIRHHERQLIAAELLIVADRFRGHNSGSSTSDLLLTVAGLIANREVI